MNNNSPDEKYKAFLSSLYKELKEEELMEAEMANEEIHEVFEKAIARPDESIRFPNKNLLKKQEDHKIRRLFNYAAPALSIAAMIVLALIMQSQLPESGGSFNGENESNSIQPNFPVMESPLNSTMVNTVVPNSTNGRNNSNSANQSNLHSNSYPVNSKEVILSREQLKTALQYIRNGSFNPGGVKLSLPVSEEYISSLIFRNRQGLGQAEARVFLDDPLGKNNTRIEDNDNTVHHNFNNLNKDNIYSLHVSLARW